MARPRNVALAAVLAANGVLAQGPSCFNLQGYSDTVTALYAQVTSGGSDTFTAGFVAADTDATVFYLDPATGQLQDTTSGTPWKIANVDATFSFDYIFFDTADVIQQFSAVPLNCTSDAATLSCEGNPGMGVFNYCEGVLALGDRAYPEYNCEQMVIVVNSVACPAMPTSTTTSTTSTSISSASTVAPVVTGNSTISGNSTAAATSVVLTTSTVMTTATITLTQGGVSVTTYPAYTSVYAIPGQGAQGYHASAPGYKTPVYHPGHLAALPPTVCASQLNAVASKYPAGALNSYKDYGVTPVYTNDQAGGNTGGYTGGHTEDHTGDHTGSYGAGNNAYVSNAQPETNQGTYSANNGSATYPQGAAAPSGTGSYHYPSPPAYTGSAATVKMALGSVLAAAVAFVCLI